MGNINDFSFYLGRFINGTIFGGNGCRDIIAALEGMSKMLAIVFFGHHIANGWLASYRSP